MRNLNYLQYFLIFTLAAALAISGCNKNGQNADQQNQAQNAAQSADPNQDPAAQANLAPAVNTTQEIPTGSEPQAPARQSARETRRLPDRNDAYYGNQYGPSEEPYDYDAPVPNYESQAQPVEYAPAPPPLLPEYDQPPAPGPNYLWTPGYWAYANTGYYWVPGVWVVAPYIGALWTPGYWGYYQNRYCWHPGYWGPHVGFYGGVNYGYGYTGRGYEGGYWRDNDFYYNTSVTRVNTTVIHNTYIHNVTVINDTRVSYNGGGGSNLQPTPAENIAWREQHAPPLPEQIQHARQASTNREQWAAVNHGRPAVLTAPRPL
ncbi:MAG: YXWGXW repeat-containing protein, partial [Silvibacterium sp.]|nr:YXWGXW repeat-containing protein [Silvibacterium sp.]